MRKFPSTAFPLFLMTVLCVSAASLQAQTCSGTGDLQGSYGLIATKLALTAPTATTPADTTGSTTPPVPSSTAIGKLVSGVAGGSAFAAEGRLLADGAGNFFASATSDPTGQVQVGTYTVNGDCTVSATISDAFAIAPLAPIAYTAAQATFEGVLLNRGSSIELIAGGSVPTRLTLVRTGTPQSCSAGDVAGAYAVSASGIDLGVTSATPAAPAPLSIIARAVSNGNGNFVADQPSVASPLSKRTLTGTYTVNADCTGTAKLVDADQKTWNLGFVLVDPSSQCAVGSAPNRTHKTLSFVFTDSRFAVNGVFQ